jgi:hypothetical protein
VVSRSTESSVTAVFQEFLAAAGGWTGGTGTTFTGRPSADTRTEALRLDDAPPSQDAMAEAVDAALPGDGLELDPQRLYKGKGYPLVFVSYAVACAGDPGVRDLLLSAVGRQSTDDLFLLPTGGWAKRLLEELR